MGEAGPLRHMASPVPQVRLCNTSHEGIEISLQDPFLPFLLIHHHLRIRPRSYVKLPVRFIPSIRGDFEATLVAFLQVNGKTAAACRVTIVGSAV